MCIRLQLERTSVHPGQDIFGAVLACAAVAGSLSRVSGRDRILGMQPRPL